jgi:hypothetical protein
MMKSPIQLFTALAILLATATVAAQVYKWVDKDGKVQYTDTPPPPGAAKADPKRVETGATSAPSEGATTTGKSLQERSKDFDKRRTDAESKAKKDTEAEKVAKNNEQICRDAKIFLSDLESGRPIYRSNEKGERELVGEDQRQADLAKARETITAACKG